MADSGHHLVTRPFCALVGLQLKNLSALSFERKKPLAGEVRKILAPQGVARSPSMQARLRRSHNWSQSLPVCPLPVRVPTTSCVQSSPLEDSICAKQVRPGHFITLEDQTGSMDECVGIAAESPTVLF